MLISFPAPALCQGGDEDLLGAIGDIVYPGFIRRPSGENGLRLWVEGDPRDPQSRALATAMFQTLLGALRAFRVEAGELREELLAGLGAGSVRDEAGNQWVGVGTVRVFATFGGEVDAFSTDVRDAIAKSQALRNALWLNGRLGRTAAADYYMIHEYAQQTSAERRVCAMLSASVRTLRTGSLRRPTTFPRSKAAVMRREPDPRRGVSRSSGPSPPIC